MAENNNETIFFCINNNLKNICALAAYIYMHKS